MNKLLTKIVGLSLGLSMAIGVGVAVAATKSNPAEQTDAAAPTSWSQCSDVTDIAAGDSIIIVTNDGTSYYFNGSTKSGPHWASTALSTSSPSSDTADGVITLVSTGTANKYKLQLAGGTNAGKFVTATKAASKGSAISDTDSYGWSFAKESAGKFELTYGNSSAAAKFCSYNNSDFRSYASYGTNQQVTIYKYSASGPSISLSDTVVNVPLNGDKTFTVTTANLTENFSISGGVDAKFTTTYTASKTDGNHTVTLHGVALTTSAITLTVSSTGATSKTINVNVIEAKEFSLITMTSKLVDGGHYLLASTGTNTIMSTTQNGNNRGNTTASGTSPYSTLTTNSADAAIITISKGSGDYADYYTLYDPINAGYLYDPNDGNKLRTNATIGGSTGTDYGYWSIEFTDNHAIISNKGHSGFHIRFNANDKIFSDYSTAQTHIDLYLLTSELPSDTDISSFSMPSGTISFENLDSYVLTGTYSPANANETVTPTMADNSTGEVEFGEVELNSGTFTVTLTGKIAGSVGVVLTGDRSGVTGTKYVTVSDSTRIYDSGKLNKDSVATTLGDGVATSGVTWFTNDATMQDTEKVFSTATDSVRGVGLGSAGSPVDTVALTSDLFVGEDYKGDIAHLMSSIIVNASVAKDGEATLAVKVNGTQVGSTQNLTADATDYAFTPASPVAGHISIEIDNNAAKAVYIGSIIIKGVALDERDSDVYYSIAKQLEAIDSCEIDSSSWSTFLATEDSYFGMTYGDIFDLAESDFSAITLWDHASEDPSSLKTSGYNAFFKYSYISSRFDPNSLAFVLPGFSSDETSTAVTIIAIISVISVSAIGGFFFLRKRKEQ